MQILTMAPRLLLCAAAALAACSTALAQAPAMPAPANAGAAAEVFVQSGNSLMATMVRFSPDGRRMATCDGRGAVLGWDAISGRQYRELHKHNGMCLGLAFTPDGQGVLSSGGASSGNDVVLSRWTDGAELQSWTGYKGQILEVVATADGKGAFALGDRAVLLRLAQGQAAPAQALPLLLPGEAADTAPFNVAMAVSRDQRTAYVARRDGSVLAVRLDGATPPVQVAKLAEAISAIALSPDGRLLALSLGTMRGSASKDVVLADAATGREVRRLAGHAGNVFALAFSPDGKLLASAAQIDMQTMLNERFSAIRDHEALRLWRLEDGAVLADMRNRRNLNGTPFLRGTLDFTATQDAGQAVTRLGMALWDEAARVYEVDAAQGLRLVHLLEGRGLAPRDLRTSDRTGRMLVSDGRPRVAPKDSYLQAADVRREFGKDADWTAAREKRVTELYTERGFRTNTQRASLWDLKTGRLEQVLDWQRGPTSNLGLDAQGRFTSVAPLFPHTIMIAPLRTRMVREATADAQGNVTLRHFGYEHWDGKPDEIFTAITPAPAPPAQPQAASAPAQPAHAGSYGTDIIVQSPSQGWTVVAGVPIEDRKDAATSKLAPRIFVQQRLADGSQVHRHDIAMPGVVRAMAISADERTLWVSGTAKGLPSDMAHEAWLMAVNLADGQVARQWALAQGVTVDVIVAHPAGNMAITNGGTNLSIWDREQATRKYFVKASDSLRPVRALALSADGKTIAASDTTGWTVLWNWPDGAEPVQRWTRALAAPSPHLLGFMAGDQRLTAGASDGSVRLLSAGDGGEIARMIRFDNDEWITIIPEGYFVASQDGDRLVNVRMNGEVYGIDQFYDVFYRPDIVERRLAGKPIAPLITVTLQDALRQPPPQVTLTLPSGAMPGAGGKYRINLEALSKGGGVGEVRVMHNGKLVEVLNRAVVSSGLAAPAAASAQPAAPALAAQARNPAVAEETVTRALRLAVQAQQGAAPAAPPLQRLSGSVEVDLVPGENSFAVIGFNSPGNLNARPVTRAVTAQGTAPAPRVFVLAVGINNFSHPNAIPLKGAVKDSSDFSLALKGRLGATYRDAPILVRTLHNEQATRAGLTAALEQLRKEVRAGDLLVWFVASHGTLDSSGQYGIILHDWDGRASPGSLFSTFNILEASRSIKAFNQLVILDTCHAGGVNSLVRGLYDARLAVLARNMGLHVFASAADTEEAIDQYQGNGLFTHTLLKGLATPLADRNSDRKVTVNELGEFARRETLRIARSVGHSQEPLMMNFGKDVTVYAID
ncbi:MAG: caspase family protein [Pseudomonadota bacterium]